MEDKHRLANDRLIALISHLKITPYQVYTCDLNSLESLNKLKITIAELSLSYHEHKF